MKNFIVPIVLLVSLQLSAQIQKVEPPFWWSGMQDPDLQLLVYGKGINTLQPEFESDIPIKDIQTTDNPNYLFITLDTKGVKPGKYRLNFKKEGKTVHKLDYEFKKRKTNSVKRQGFDSSDVIYLLMPDRFANGNSKNDSKKSVTEKADRTDPDGRHGGDIEGIVQHLDYLENLGVTAIWSTPLLEDNEPKGSYHGYAASDYYRIDPRYGTNEDYKHLADEMHHRGMKLIMDYVTNHWGSQSWIIKDLPSKDWIHYWEDTPNGFKRSNYRLTTQTDLHASQVDKKINEDGWFDTSMPDMNQKNPLVLNYMVQNAIWWIEYTGLDGLRVDTYPYNDKKGIAEWTKRIMDEYPNFNIVGEVWVHSQAQISYWQKDSEIGAIEGYNSYLPSVMDFTLQDAVMQSFHEDKQDWDTGMMRVYQNFAHDFLYPEINNILVFLENHDTNRFNQAYDKFEDYRLAMSLIMTVRGIPQIYYGSEIGMKGDKSKGDGDIRRDFPGGWESDTQNAFTNSGRTDQQQQYFDFTQNLLNWRQDNSVIHNGKTVHFIPQDNVYVYFRYNDKNTVMVILNNNPESQTLDLKRFAEGIKDHKKGKNILTGDEFDLSDQLEIKGKTPLILELK